MSRPESGAGIDALLARVRVHVAHGDLPAALDACRALNSALSLSTRTKVPDIRGDLKLLKGKTLELREGCRRDLLEIASKRQVASAYQNSP